MMRGGAIGLFAGIGIGSVSSHKNNGAIHFINTTTYENVTNIKTKPKVNLFQFEIINWKITCVYAINEIQNVFDGRGTVSVPHKNTINGIGNANILCDTTILMNTSR